MPKSLLRLFTLVFFLLFAAVNLSGQNILSPDKSGANVINPPTDQVWAPQRRVNPYRNLIRIDFEHPFYVMDDVAIIPSDGRDIRINDSTEPAHGIYNSRNFNEYLNNVYMDSIARLTDKQKEFIAYCLYYRNYFIKPPVLFNDAIYFNPSGDVLDKLIHSYSRQNWNPFPEAFRFYANPIGDTVAPGLYNMKFKLNIPLKDIVSPFYFKKGTITNKEYREFTKWVKDSLLHLYLYAGGDSTQALPGYDLDPPPINWKAKIELSSQDAQEATAELFLPESQRFYRKRDFDARRILYQYYTIHPGQPYDAIRKIRWGPDRHITSIYPDTLVWIHDFTLSFLEEKINIYNWHPAYDDYPVVGITRWQAIAYLNWKSKQEQQKLNDEGKSEWVISYELPTEYEWEMVETADRINEQPEIYPDYFRKMSDYSYITDLSFTYDSPNIQASFSDNRCTLLNKSKDSLVLRKIAYPHVPYIDFTNFQYLYDHPDKKHHVYHDEPLVMSEFEKNDKYIKKNPFWNANYDCNGISFMGGNVSEWMQESYNHNWKKVYDYQHNFLENLNGKDAKLELSMEDYYNTRNDTTYYANDLDTSISYLVRGANWYDRRTGSINGKNIAGMNTKIFINADSAHSTLGFRYVIKLHRRDEKKIIDSIKSTIHYKPKLKKDN